MTYKEFLQSKVEIATDSGFEIDKSKINKALKPHQRDAVAWALRGGKRALFESFGLGKTVQEIELCHLAAEHEKGQALIVLPLGVKQEFTRDAVEVLGYEKPQYCKTMEEVKASTSQIVLTNYERVRDGDIMPEYFCATSLDEASVLRSFGSKTYQTFLDKFKHVPYKFVATATPSPNKYKELIHYAGYLEVMDTGQALTRFFQRDSTKANNLTLYPNMEDEFWLWASSWALFVTKPSDLNPTYSDEGYDLPPLKVNWHEIPVDYGDTADKDGQIQLFQEAAEGLKQAAEVKRNSIDLRVTKMKEIVDSAPNDNFLLWHDLESERHAIKKTLPEVVDIYGSMDYDLREKRVIDFSNGETRLFATKKSLSGSGCNFQRYCHREIFLGIDYEFNDFIQAIHRYYRFLQKDTVVIDIIYMENERQIKKALIEKWKNHDNMIKKMITIVKKYGLDSANKTENLERKMGVEGTREQRTVTGKHYEIVYGDCVEETRNMESNSVDLIHTSIPFGNHYEYSANFNDFGHNQNTDRFFEQMDFLTPELLRILRPGRVAAIHVKDRVLFGNATGTGMPTIEPFHALCIEHYMKHGFQYFGMITVVTDVVRENNQTYRLGWTEQCKDGSKMGVGCPEYVLLFRKLPTDRSTAYADTPVVKQKEDYTRAQWQIDAHGYWRSSGDRLVSKDELKDIPVNNLQAVYRKYSREHIYDYEEHVELAKQLDENGKLPAAFMVVAPGSWNNLEVWDDINRMKTLNTTQSRRRNQMHVCLKRGSLILTRRGYIPIEDISIGDIVLTHKGNWKPVIAKKCTGINDTIQTKAQGVPNLITTPDHKLWVRKVDKYVRKKDYIEKVKPDWLEAKNCKNNYINLKLPDVEASKLSDTEWWLVGRYLADGHIGTRGDYFISVGTHKAAIFEEKADTFWGIYADKGTCRQYRLLSNNMSSELKNMINKCGYGAANKQVPIEGLCLNKKLSKALLDGYLSGDGSTTGDATTASSVSRALLLGVAMLVQRVYGKIASIHKGKDTGKYTIEGRTVHQKQEWILSWRNGSHEHGTILEDGAWKKVYTPINTGKAETWSIQVQDDASYTAEGCIVKNCPLQIDIVERIINRYSNEGYIVYDPFGGLMTVPMTAVKMHRYGKGCELNADYFRDGVGYCQEAESEIETPTLFDFIC
jgi:DNA modification methylase